METTTNAGIDNLISDVKPTEGGTTPQEANQQKTAEAPKFFAQLKKEIAENEDVKKYAGSHADLNELVKDFTESKKILEKALVLPGEDATEEQIYDFFGKLGVPKDASGYTLSDFDVPAEDIKPLKDSFLAAAHKAALSNKQAQHMWQHIVAAGKAGNQILANKEKAVKEAFDPQYNKLMEKEYPVEAERVTAIKGEISLAKSFMQRTGTMDAVVKSGLIYNPEFIHAIAKEEKSHKPAIVEGSPNNTQKQEGMVYGSEFMSSIGAQ